MLSTKACRDSLESEEKKNDPKNGLQIWRQSLKNGLQQRKTEQKKCSYI